MNEQSQRGPESPAPKDAGEAPPREDLDAALRFVHVMGMQTKREAFNTTARLETLIEQLVSSGALDLRAFEERRDRVRERELKRTQGDLAVMIGEAADKYSLTDLPDIPCGELLPLCKARCCMFDHALTFQDLDEGKVKFEYERPYMIRHRPDGMCVHNKGDHACGVYEHRPAVCRSYDCREDKRVWLDYEARVVAPLP